MKVLLIAPPILDRSPDGQLVPAELDAYRLCPPYGLYLLAAELERAGHQAPIADLVASGGHSIAPFAAELDGAGLAAISATSLSFATALDLARQIRARRPELPIVFGNVHPTLFDRYLLASHPIDYVVRGEGERALCALASALERGDPIDSVPSLSWRAPGGAVVRNPEGVQLDPAALAAAPLPRYDLLPDGAYRGLALESSRGCALDCSFCSTPYRRSFRALAPGAFVDRLEGIAPHLARTREATVHVIDDEFSMDPRRAAAIGGEIARRGLTPRLIYDSRAIDFLRGGFGEAIAPYTHRFLIGAECGYDDGLRRVGKGITCRMLEQAAERAAELGIAARGEFSFILGLPWETMAEVLLTLRFAARLHALHGVTIRLNWYTQMPGSRLWQEARDRLAVAETMYDDYGFWQDLYLFRSGVGLSPREVWEVGEIVEQLQRVSRATDRAGASIDFFFPGSIRRWFPRELCGAPTAEALANLRSIARARR